MTNATHDAREDAQTIAEIELANAQFARSESDNATMVPQVELSEEAIAAVNEERIATYRARAKAQRARGVKSLAERHQGVPAILEQVKIDVPAVAALVERWYASMEFGIHVLKRRGAIVLGDKRAEALHAAMEEQLVELEKRAKASMVIVENALKEATTNAAVADTPLLLPTFAKPAADHEIQMRTREAKRLLEVFKTYDRVLAMCVTLEWNDAFTSKQIATLTDEFRDGMKGLSKFLGQTVRGMKNKVSPLDEQSAGAGVASASAEAAAELQAA